MNQEINVEEEIFIAASPETVFGFFVEPDFMALWFGLQHALDPRPGGIFRVEVSAGEFARGIYREVTPHRRIAFTWGWEGRDDLPPGRSPCFDFGTAASQQPPERRSRQRTTGRDGRTTWCGWKKQCAIPTGHKRRKS